MTRASMLALLRELEVNVESECPICFGGRETTNASFCIDHAHDCKLAAAIAWLEDEKNITNGGCCNVDGWLLWDER